MPYKYTGKELDNTGLYYYEARYYDATVGRFLSADTLVPNPEDPQDLNRYSYVDNNPLRYTDPSGHAVSCATNDGSHFCNSLATQNGQPIVSSYFQQPIAGSTQSGRDPITAAPPAPKPGRAALAFDATTFLEKYQLPEFSPSGAGLGVVKFGKLVAQGITSVIGRGSDLKSLQAGMKSLIDRLPDLGSPKANWKQNAGVLREEMRRGAPILDVSPGNTEGQFLNAERYLLKDRSWTFDSKTNYWMPPNP